jgi:hypothetical protein
LHHLHSLTKGSEYCGVDPASAAPAKISSVPVHCTGVTCSCRKTRPSRADITYPLAVTGKTNVRSATLKSAIRPSSQKICMPMPRTSSGSNSNRRRDPQLNGTICETPRTPQVKKRLLKGFSRTTTTNSTAVRRGLFNIVLTPASVTRLEKIEVPASSSVYAVGAKH